ncbi:hypothetical protein ACNTMW_13280 [Planosporangium sp. 12N6]|uniref:hypothetical protein n=1 Tax=Planosporangium spinosum TaxID=3402278 RepID=UPI003CF4F3C1
MPIGRSEDDFLGEWDVFRAPDIFECIDSIHRFALEVQYPQFTHWESTTSMSGVHDALYEEVYELLSRTGLYRYDSLERASDSDSVRVEYNDADQGFAVVFTRGNQLRLERTGSSFRRFFDWYKLILPGVAKVEAALREELERLCSRDERRHIEPARASYHFAFILHDFSQGRSRANRVRNSHVLRRALTHVPSGDGGLVELSDKEIPDLGRIDLAVSRWQDGPSGPVREIYDIQAPGNRDYGTVWIYLTYVAESRLEAEPPRQQPDFDMFLQRYDYPLVEFVRERALARFITEMTDGLLFRSTPGQLP